MSESSDTPHAFRRNPLFIRLFLGLSALQRVIFRVRILGEEKIPPFPTLWVANHNIGAAIEIPALLYAWEKKNDFRYENPIFGLTHRISFRVPGVSAVVRGIGAVPADYDSAFSVLRAGHTLAIFPGGSHEVTRSFWERDRVDFGGHMGWAKIALEAGVRVVPIAISGSHSVNPVLWRSVFLARVFGLKRFFALSAFPVTLGQVFWVSLFLGWVGPEVAIPWKILGALNLFLWTPLIPIWPARITITFLDPIDPRGRDSAELYAQVTDGIQDTILEAQKKKKPEA